LSERGAGVIPAGLALGAFTGVAARAWMRLISNDPEFSWSGTVFVVATFAVAGLVQGLALAVRGRHWSWWWQWPVRLLAGFGAVLLGAGAGIVMLPTIVTGSLATARTDWSRPARSVVGAVAATNAVAMLWLLGDGLPIWRLAAGWFSMLALYYVVIAGVSLNLRPLAGGPVVRGRTVATIAAGAAVVIMALIGLAARGV